MLRLVEKIIMALNQKIWKIEKNKPVEVESYILNKLTLEGILPCGTPIFSVLKLTDAHPSSKKPAARHKFRLT